VFSSLYYSPLLLGNIWRAIDPGATAGAEPSIAKVVVETARTLIITFVLARVMALMGVADVKSAVQLALWLWFDFSAMMWVGAIMWEETPWKIAAIHSGDWLVKTVLIAAILGAWRRRPRPREGRFRSLRHVRVSAVFLEAGKRSSTRSYKENSQDDQARGFRRHFHDGDRAAEAFVERGLRVPLTSDV